MSQTITQVNKVIKNATYIIRRYCEIVIGNRNYDNLTVTYTLSHLN